MKTRDFFNDLAVLMGRQPQEMEPYIDALESKWFDTVEILREMTTKDWEDLEIMMPRGLSILVMKRLGSAQNKDTSQSISFDVKKWNGKIVSIQSTKFPWHFIDNANH